MTHQGEVLGLEVIQVLSRSSTIRGEKQKWEKKNLPHSVQDYQFWDYISEATENTVMPPNWNFT